MILWFIIGAATVMVLLNWLVGTYINDPIVRGWSVFFMGVVYTLIIVGLILTLINALPEAFILMKPLDTAKSGK